MDTKFCPNCGARIEEGTRFCTSCGADVYAGTPSVQQPFIPPKKKTPVLPVILVSVLGAAILITGIVLIVKFFKVRAPGTDVSSLDGSSAIVLDTAIVSRGVRYSDLGNILNGQYYFATDDKIFYSSFDRSGNAHIYSADKDGTNTKVIFDGFGWSLVVVDDWLYFSGNSGAAIDGSYFLYRMKQDGSQIETINDRYSYGMFMYDEYLYYMNKSDQDSNMLSVCRSGLDGSNKEIIFPNGMNPLVYKDKLYYFDNQGNMFRTEPDGSSPQVLLTAQVKFYVLSGDKIVYLDFEDGINVCDLDGSNNVLVRSTSGKPVNSINVYNGKIFLFEYDPEFNNAAYGYDYSIKSCNMDGSDEKTLFSSTSYGVYTNAVSDKLMVMEYAMDQNTSQMTAYIKVMGLDGSALSELPR